MKTSGKKRYIYHKWVSNTNNTRYDLYNEAHYIKSEKYRKR